MNYAEPFCWVGAGRASFPMKRGSFKFREKISEKIPLYLSEGNILRDASGCALFSLQIKYGDNQIRLHLEPLTGRPFKRLWLRLPGEKDEHIYGCGEQFTRLDTRREGAHLGTGTPERRLHHQKKPAGAGQAQAQARLCGAL